MRRPAIRPSGYGDGGGLRGLGGIGPGLGQHDQHGPGLHRGAHRDGPLTHQVGGPRPHLVLHLHRLDDEQFVARPDQRTRRDPPAPPPPRPGPGPRPPPSSPFSPPPTPRIPPPAATRSPGATDTTDR